MVTQLLGELGRNKRRTWRLMAALVVAGLFSAISAACGDTAGVIVESEGGAAIEALTNAPADDVAAGPGDGGLAGAAIEAPTDVPAVTQAPPVLAAGATGQPAGEVLAYPTEFTLGSMLPGHDALDQIAPAGSAERQALESELAAMGQGAPTSERVFGLNVSDSEHPSWTSLPGDTHAMYVALVREGGATKIDPALHDWRARNAVGVEFVEWREVTPPTGTDNLRLVANGPTTVIGAFQVDSLVYWFSTEAGDGQGDWLPNDSNLPEGASEYSYDNDRKTWLTQVGEVVYEYRSGNWNEVFEIGQMRDGHWWDGTGWQALPGEGWQVSVAEDGTVRATDANGVEYSSVEGSWLTKALVETTKAVEYVERERVSLHPNHESISGIRISASETMQTIANSSLPEEFKAMGSHPMFVVAPDPAQLREAIDACSVYVSGESEKIALEGRKVEIFFQAEGEDSGIRFTHVDSGGSQSWKFGAFKKDDGSVLVVAQVPEYLSSPHSSSEMDVMQLMFEGVIQGLGELSIKPELDWRVNERPWWYDSHYDDSNPLLAEDRTFLLLFYLARPTPISSGKLYGSSDFFSDYEEWLPEEYRDHILSLNW